MRTMWMEKGKRDCARGDGRKERMRAKWSPMRSLHLLTSTGQTHICSINDVKPAIRREVLRHCKLFLVYHPTLRQSVLGMLESSQILC